VIWIRFASGRLVEACRVLEDLADVSPRSNEEHEGHEGIGIGVVAYDHWFSN
jgi:hypothetical protein